MIFKIIHGLIQILILLTNNESIRITKSANPHARKDF